MELKTMKKLKFRHNLVKLILHREKITTWRLFDDKDLKIGDTLEFIDSETNQKFAEAEILEVKEKELGKVESSDFEGHEKYESRANMISHYRQYYGNKVTQKTIVKIIKFRLPENTRI